MISLGYSLYVIWGKFRDSFLANNPFGQISLGKGFNFRFFKVFCKNYFLLIGRTVKVVWNEGQSLIRAKLARARELTILNFKKYFFLTAPVGIILAVFLYVGLFVAILSAIFVPLVLIELVWATIVALFFRR